MSEFNPEKLHVQSNFQENIEKSVFPRKYTLTHSDITGDLFLSIGPEYDHKKLKNLYSRLLRDEVLGEWQNKDRARLDIHCHCSGGIVLGSAKWRDSIFRHHMPMVLKALCYGDRPFLLKNRHLQKTPIYIHFHASQKRFNRKEKWGVIRDYMLDRL